MDKKFNLSDIQKISNYQQLFIDLLTFGIIPITVNSDMDRNEQMNYWVFEHFETDVTKYIDEINNICKRYGYPERHYKYLQK